MKTKIFILVSVFLMILMDASGMFSYFQRSIIKCVVFGVIPFILLQRKNIKLPTLKRNDQTKYIVVFSVIVVILILIGASVLNNLGMFNAVKDSLTNQVGVHRSNYPYVFVYIVLINGPLEEYYFRYYLLQQNSKSQTLLSSGLFAIYHVGMLFTMFDWYLFILAIVGLMLVGFVFIKINSPKNSILNSIILHMAANIAINIVGWMLIMV